MVLGSASEERSGFTQEVDLTHKSEFMGSQLPMS